MGSRLIVRVTPYAAFAVPTKTEQYQAAGMCCRALTDKPFCAMCGAAVKPQTKERFVEEARICDLAEEIKEVLVGQHVPSDGDRPRERPGRIESSRAGNHS